ncbi:lipoprotein-releasing system ATP-binding protein [Geothermobacter ehrlichii]|uniref:Lipoprotein-releasing system ATP-binding protein n=1 Tax=Geothermobacter ehrlichii TaxID=213224 RepID=A0A5D3WLK7_9BACT|nr:ABC transporter ATP-binding protein [Geothermobacter ehrlichii]TYP00036.1 lipoprotein-releasing system ATP-binding protein [Geothermobacter ehrlichii]
MSDDRISVRNLVKSYPTAEGTVEVLRGIDLDIMTGERLAIVGASGAGKSTLMHILGGLDRPTDGRVCYSGQNIWALPEAGIDSFRNRTIGFVFQFHQLLPEFTALENVMMPMLVGGSGRREARENAERLLREVGLGHRLGHKPGQLSGGEQQRVAIARALVMEPKVLLADEPTGNLDSTTSESVWRLLEQVHERYQLTMIIVTHSETLAGRMDRIVRMADGRILP